MRRDMHAIVCVHDQRAVTMGGVRCKGRGWDAVHDDSVCVCHMRAMTMRRGRTVSSSPLSNLSRVALLLLGVARIHIFSLVHLHYTVSVRVDSQIRLLRLATLYM